jgi:hypothetical protein
MANVAARTTITPTLIQSARIMPSPKKRTPGG